VPEYPLALRLVVEPVPHVDSTVTPLLDAKAAPDLLATRGAIGTCPALIAQHHLTSVLALVWESVVLDVDESRVVQPHPLLKVLVWQLEGIALVYFFRNG